MVDFENFKRKKVLRFGQNFEFTREEEGCRQEVIAYNKLTGKLKKDRQFSKFFVSSNLNISVDTRLKMYICQRWKCFKYTSTPPIGMIKMSGICDVGETEYGVS